MHLKRTYLKADLMTDHRQFTSTTPNAVGNRKYNHRELSRYRKIII
jgi:hypothetical protein